MSEAIELSSSTKEPSSKEEAPKFSSKDERDFREFSSLERKQLTETTNVGPASIQELYAHQKYKPFKAVYTKSNGEKIDLNVGCWLACQDLAIMLSILLTLWAFLLAIYALLVKAALDTDEKSTALWIFFVFGCFFVVGVVGSAFMVSNSLRSFSPRWSTERPRRKARHQSQGQVRARRSRRSGLGQYTFFSTWLFGRSVSVLGKQAIM